MIDTLPPAATRADTPEDFIAKENAWRIAMVTFGAQVNAAALAMNLNSTTDTSASSVAIGTGSKSFTVSAGKSFLGGMFLVIADTAAPSTNWMFGQVTSYSGTSLVMNILSVGGSGTKTSWTISQSAAGVSSGGVVAGLGSNTFTGVQKWAKGADVASAAALTLGTDGNYFDITGTTGITSISTMGVGTCVRLHFDAALTLTHHATDLILPGAANITTAAGDEAEFVEYAAGDWRCVSYTRASGLPVTVLPNITLGTPAASTSGTSIDFTGIPAGTRRICIVGVGVSTNNTSPLICQIGDSGGVETTGYDSGVGKVASATNYQTSTTSFLMSGDSTDAAADVLRFKIVLDLANAATNTWLFNSSMHTSGVAEISLGVGAKALSATLDRVRITTAGGTATFDAGEINITYEG